MPPQPSLSQLLAAVFSPNDERSDATPADILSADGVVFAGGSTKPADVLAFVESLDKLDAKSIESHLLPRTFAVGDELTAADYALFHTTAPRIVAASHTERLQTPATTRHFDMMQHEPRLMQALGRLDSPLATPTPIAVDDVPKVDRSAEMTKKKAKKPAPIDGAAPVAPSADKSAKAPVAGAVAAPVGKAKKEKAKGEDKPAKGGKGGAAPSAAAAESSAPKPSMIDLRVGRIVDVKKHPDADSLYVEQIDIGEAEPRTVVSGLVNYVPIEEMRGKLLIAVCNLKPASMRGVKSFAMVLCASAKEGKGAPGSVEICDPPAGSEPGDRVYFEGMEGDEPLEQLNPKKKQWETIQPGFLTLDSRECAWRDPNDESVLRKIRTSKGVVTAPNLAGATLS